MLERRQEEVDFFILYSSITSVLGNVGQTTYAAANTFMNTFADYRRYIVGKPCLAVCWGGMGGAGILERDTKVAALLDSKGLHLLHISQGEYASQTLRGMSNFDFLVLSLKVKQDCSFCRVITWWKTVSVKNNKPSRYYTR